MKCMERGRAATIVKLAWLLAAGCGASEEVRAPSLSRDAGATSESDAGRATESGAGNPSTGSGRDGSTAMGGSTAVGSGSDVGCAQVSVGTERLPVHLAFAFDVSGSMGKGDEKWHDKALKWDPVVRATRAFFEAEVAPDQAGPSLTASLTFFPADDDKCNAQSYREPDVAMTALPSADFADAIAAVEPDSEDDWRGGTPTLAAVRGTRSFVETYRAAHPGRYAIVLVSDGYPQGCDDNDDQIEAVVREAELARAAGISTYVVGVANPKIDGAPDTVSNLGQIAAAGGTEQAYLIDTGDPTATSRAFDRAIAAIRSATFSCSLQIPESPDQRPFDKRKVAVRVVRQGRAEALRYDATCQLASGWRYDDEGAPNEIVLCPATCAAIEAEPGGRLELDFACEDVLYL